VTITVKMEKINPEVAAKYLDSFKGNRAIRQTHVNYLASQMSAGLWKSTHQGIAFNAGNELVDGHHRMWAVVMSGTEINTMVTRGLAEDDVAFLDVGLVRDTKDAAHYDGVEVDPIVWPVAKILVRGVTLASPKVPFPVVNGWYQHYKAGIDAAAEYRANCQPMRQKMNSVMTAALARAFYDMERPLLDRFINTLKTGQAENKADMAAVVLRDAWLTGRVGKAQSSEAYFKMTAALRAFKERRSIKTLQRAEGEAFKLPKLPAALNYKSMNGAEHPKAGPKARKRSAEARV